MGTSRIMKTGVLQPLNGKCQNALGPLYLCPARRSVWLRIGILVSGQHTICQATILVPQLPEGSIPQLPNHDLDHMIDRSLCPECNLHVRGGVPWRSHRNGNTHRRCRAYVGSTRDTEATATYWFDCWLPGGHTIDTKRYILCIPL